MYINMVNNFKFSYKFNQIYWNFFYNLNIVMLPFFNMYVICMLYIYVCCKEGR